MIEVVGVIRSMFCRNMSSGCCFLGGRVWLTSCEEHGVLISCVLCLVYSGDVHALVVFISGT